ncbi:hypothetical protein KSP40_PGU007655 [Platanthera guangdongensis]|uniref:Uncharacterized protein n=1 Tax=Platanthera guangdongensis TaxID=2320717 RepID=A0ABR2LE21_9ASPA
MALHFPLSSSMHSRMRPSLSPAMPRRQPFSPAIRRRRILSSSISSPVLRRTAKFQPTMFDDAYIQSLPTVVSKDKVHGLSRREQLKDEVRCMILKEKGLVDQLELLDSLQQLGVAYHFEREIEYALSRMHSHIRTLCNTLSDDMHAASLIFRLLRQHGYGVSQDLLIKSFKDAQTGFKPHAFSDIKGVLSFYEASFLADDGDGHELDEGRRRAEKRLREWSRSCSLNDQENHISLAELVDHALELPLHWRTPRLHSLWFIGAYGRIEGMDPRLLELAKLDFNIVQRIYKLELKEVSRWWRKLGLADDKLKFARNWPVESYVWTVGLVSEPHFSRCRKELAKTVCFLHVVDDIYDIYGSLDELMLFTDAIHRWEMAAVDKLPEYMKPCFIALLNTVNELAFVTFQNKGLDILPHLKRAWSDICKAFLVEARWCNSGYIPTLEEYLDNAWISVAAPLTLVYSQCLSENLTMKSLENLYFYPSMARHSSTIFRLHDDLGTSKVEIQRGDVAKSMQCYMKEKGVVERVACEKMKDLIHEKWKLLNGEQAANSQFEESFKRVVMNLPRMAQFMYDNRDGNGKPNHRMKDLIVSLLIEPIPL